MKYYVSYSWIGNRGLTPFTYQEVSGFGDSYVTIPDDKLVTHHIEDIKSNIATSLENQHTDVSKVRVTLLNFIKLSD